MRRLLLGALLVTLAACASPPKGTVRPVSEPVPPPPSASPPSASTTPFGERIARGARGYLGTPYRYGGADANGMDCSGLVLRVFAERGHSMPRTSEAQYEVGTPVPREALQAGDLLFFGDDRGRVNHVGIHLGEGRFVHASTGQRKVVVDTLRNQWFRDRYVGARRVRR